MLCMCQKIFKNNLCKTHYKMKLKKENKLKEKENKLKEKENKLQEKLEKMNPQIPIKNVKIKKNKTIIQYLK